MTLSRAVTARQACVSALAPLLDTEHEAGARRAIREACERLIRIVYGLGTAAVDTTGLHSPDGELLYEATTSRIGHLSITLPLALLPISADIPQDKTWTNSQIRAVVVTLAAACWYGGANVADYPRSKDKGWYNAADLGANNHISQIASCDEGRFDRLLVLANVLVCRWARFGRPTHGCVQAIEWITRNKPNYQDQEEA